MESASNLYGTAGHIHMHLQSQNVRSEIPVLISHCLLTYSFILDGWELQLYGECAGLYI
jgi:hypothetical protein